MGYRPKVNEIIIIVIIIIVIIIIVIISLRPGLVFVLNNTTVYLLELTVGFESNIKVNSERKAAKYHPLLTNLRTEYTNINFVNLSMSALGIYGTSSDTFLQMLKDLNFNQSLTHHMIMKASNIAIRCTYYIYCRRNKQWSNPELLQYWYSMFSFRVFV